MQVATTEQIYKIFEQNPIISTDSRKGVANSIFFALKGENFNANAFALSALEKGCSYAVVDEAEYVLDNRFLLVDDVLLALQALAKFHRQKLGTKIIGITGTNGKTTTKELLAAVLKEKYQVLYTQGNLNNHIGVPLTLLQLRPEHEIAVVEMGANHQGEIKLLAEIAQPNYAIVTNVGKAHLEGFGSFEGVKKTKKELYQYITASKGVAFINSADPVLMQMAKEAGLKEDAKKLITYARSSDNKKADCTGTVLSCSPFLSMCCHTTEGNLEFTTLLIGSYNAENLLAAACIAKYFSVSNEQIKQGLENYQPTNNRSQFVETNSNQLIVDAYNANPSSMAVAIENFAEIEASNKLLILGDMRELGDDSLKEHQKIIEQVESKQFENVFLVGSVFQETKTSFRSFPTVIELKEYLKEQKIEKKSILIKGSRGIKLEEILSFL